MISNIIYVINSTKSLFLNNTLGLIHYLLRDENFISGVCQHISQLY